MVEAAGNSDGPQKTEEELAEELRKAIEETYNQPIEQTPVT